MGSKEGERVREIKFRGIPENTNLFSTDFIYGDLRHMYGKVYIAQDKERSNAIRVNSETVGEYTGQKDKNGKDSYFNDRCNYEYYIFTSANPESTPNKYEGTGVIVFIEGAFMIKPDGKKNPIPLHYAELSFEIIGTIHEVT